MTPRSRRIRSACGLALAVALMLAGNVAPVVAAPVPEQRAACTSDVFRLCGAEAPRVDQIIACLKKARPSLSPACRAVVDAKG
ncbi:MAG: hypothetical protein HXX10_13440 [Rhodoplanes sp.]|uniref:hypothetical protein n=1 Tax=Rhodoplanes sp. TaxID=1968906 RepID=UPI0018370CF7|nr:hypothetical protein [Rhodoplanes sp.]NVO15032.1 hypothetical protein [Rhodoplanes sp.]